MYTKEDLNADLLRVAFLKDEARTLRAEGRDYAALHDLDNANLVNAQASDIEMRARAAKKEAYAKYANANG